MALTIKSESGKGNFYNITTEEGDYLHPNKYTPDWEILLEEMRTVLSARLADREGFHKITFVDVGGRAGIQVNMIHESQKGYVFALIHLRCDFMNMEDVLRDAPKVWDQNTANDGVKNFNDFIAAGERHGWD